MATCYAHTLLVGFPSQGELKSKASNWAANTHGWDVSLVKNLSLGRKETIVSAWNDEAASVCSLKRTAQNQALRHRRPDFITPEEKNTSHCELCLFKGDKLHW